MSKSSQNPGAGRGDILAAATDLFAESGYDAVSISAIARRAGTSKANVFHHFGCKDALYLEVMRAACRTFEDVLSELDGGVDRCGVRLRRFAQRDLEQLRAAPDRAHLILREVLESGPSRGRALATEVFDENFGELVGLFREGMASGEFTDEVPPALAASMLVACNVFLFQSQHVLRHLPGVDFVDDPERYADLVSRVLLDGLRRREPGGEAGGGSAE